MFMFALRNVFRQRTRTALTLTAIALGVASLILAGGYVEDTLVQLREATIKSGLGICKSTKRAFTRVGPTSVRLPDRGRAGN